jgi:hypothetical protein
MVMASTPTNRDFTVAPSPGLVGSPSVGQPPLDPNIQGYNPFRIATIERVENIGQLSSQAQTTAEQQLEVPLVGTGFIYGFSLFEQLVTSGNSANVVFYEDAPYALNSSIVFKDVNGELINLPGWSLKWASRYGGWEPSPLADGGVRTAGGSPATADTNIYQIVPGNVATGGSATFHLKVPVSFNRRTLLPLLGNQDRAQSYTLRHNMASGAAGALTGPFYTTAPTTLGSLTLTRIYENYAVPNAVNDNGIPNQVLPGHYGIVPFLTQNVSDAAPVGGSTINHFVRRTGNVIRMLMLVLRQNTGAASPRSTAEGNLPTSITLKVGNETLFTEPPAYRRQIMWDRYGFDAPNGVLVYDFLHDFYNRSGTEFGNDWLWTQNLLQFQFAIVYPAGLGSTSNTLTIVTSDMIVPEGSNPYAF